MKEEVLKQDYLKTVCKEISGKRVEKYIISELEEHIMEQYEYILKKEGLELKNESEEIKEKFMKQALEQTGDPVLLGKQYNKVHNPFPKWYYSLIMGISALFVSCQSIQSFFDLVSFGMIMVFALIITKILENSKQQINPFITYAKAFLIAGGILSLLSFAAGRHGSIDKTIWIKICLIPIFYGTFFYNIILLFRPIQSLYLHIYMDFISK